MKERIVFLDVAKVVTTFLVVFAHLYSGSSQERLYIYSFHMPLFFVISGMLHKYDGTIQIKKYVRTILIPTLFFIVLFDVLIVMPFHWGGWNIRWPGELRGENIWDSFLNVLLYRRAHHITTINGNGVCWFLLALFWCKIFMDFLIQKRFLLFLGILSFSALLSWYLQHSLFFLVQSFMALPFYYGGYYFKDIIIRIVNHKYSIFLALLCFMINVFLTMLNGRVSMQGVNFGGLHIPLNICVFYINGIIGTMGVLYLSSILKHTNRVITAFSMSLISIVGLQALFIYPYKYFIGFDQPLMVSTIAAIIIMLLCFVGHQVLLIVCPQIFGKK